MKKAAKKEGNIFVEITNFVKALCLQSLSHLSSHREAIRSILSYC